MVFKHSFILKGTDFFFVKHYVIYKSEFGLSYNSSTNHYAIYVLLQSNFFKNKTTLFL